MAKPLLTSHMRGWKPWTSAQSAAVKAEAAKTIAMRRSAQIIEPPKTVREMRAAMLENYRAVFDTIRKAVCAEVGADQHKIDSSSKHPRLVAARGILVYWVRAHTPLTFPQIQELMIPNSTSHSTTVTQMQRLRAKWEEDIGGGDPRTFREIIEAFDSATLKFREVGNGNR